MRHLFAYPYLCATKRLPKTWPRPAVSEGPPAIWRPNAIKPDQLLSNAQRAPEVFLAGRVKRLLQPVRGAVTLAWLAYSMGFKRVAALGRVGYEQIWAAFSG